MPEYNLRQKLDRRIVQEIEDLQKKLNPKGGPIVQGTLFSIPLPQSKNPKENVLGLSFDSKYIKLRNGELARPGMVALTCELLQVYQTALDKDFLERIYQLIKYVVVVDLMPANFYKKGVFVFANTQLRERLEKELQLKF